MPPKGSAGSRTRGSRPTRSATILADRSPFDASAAGGGLSAGPIATSPWSTPGYPPLVLREGVLDDLDDLGRRVEIEAEPVLG